MAKKRTFHKAVIFSEAFQSLPLKVRWLYILLNFEADTDGFVKFSSYTVHRCGCTEKDLQRLVSSGLLLSFPCDVYLITHWGMHNNVRPQRRGKTEFRQELQQVSMDPTGIYHLKDEHEDRQPVRHDVCQKNDQTEEGQAQKPQTSSPGPPGRKTGFIRPAIEEVRAYIQEHNYKVDADSWYDHYESNGWLVGKNKMKNWQASIRYWNKNAIDTGKGESNDHRGAKRKTGKRDFADSTFQYYDE